MNISYNWLKEYIATDVAPEKLGDILTSIGLETGTVEKVQTIRGGLEGLVVGEVLTCKDHENSDHLHVTTVNIGTETLQIVCGAANVAAGQKVIVATIGTKLYFGDECITIKKSKMRGVESFGMICAEDEIGVGTSHDGIIVLPPETPVGMSAREYYGIKDDYVLEVDITPNRADAISHYGVARDLAAYFKSHGDESTCLMRPDVSAFATDNHDTHLDVKVISHDRCPRYSGVTVKGVKVGPSPKWLQERLNVIGLRPINNVVDVTNYILHSFGQPLHAFDVAKIKGGRIEVKTVAAGTKFVTLDGVERELHEEDLMICNVEEPMCIAGVFGGLDSGVTTTTTEVFIESAYFNPVSVRKTARRHGLNTDASFRYERGIDPHNTIYTLKYAAMLIKEVAGGEISSDIVDIYPTPIEDFKVSLSYDKTNRLIGKELSHEEIKTILSALEIKIENEDNGVLSLTVPAYRVDVQRDVDVIEDILRIYGYNNVEISDKLHSNITYAARPDSHKMQNLISEQLTANGFYEIMNNSLTKSAYYNEAETYPASRCVRIMNSLSSDLDVMRQTLLFGGLETIAHNAHRQHADLKLYEFGNCYSYNAKNKKEGETLSAYTEEYHLGIWMTGRKNSLNWAVKETMTTFYLLKAHVQNILVRMGIDLKKLSVTETGDQLMPDALDMHTAGGKLIARLGIVSHKTLKHFDIDNDVFYADIEWKTLLRESAKHKISYKEIAKYPEVKRDLALLIDKKITFADIERIAFETEKKLLKSVNLFDVYEGKNLEAGKKSYAVNFTLQDAEKTLNDKQIDTIMQKLVKAFAEKAGAKLR